MGIAKEPPLNNQFEIIKQRKLLQTIATFKAEADRREARFRQTQRGYYDKDGVRQRGLIDFVRYFWDVLEPETAFVDGWPLWAICEHLEAVTFGEINRLLINVPPGFAKSLLTDVFWPAWEWGPMGKAHYRYVCFSYSQHLTMRDNDRFRTLIVSPKYQALYGIDSSTYYGKRQVKNGIAMRNTQVIKVMNQNTGWKLASSVGGVSLGERGDRIIIDDPHNLAQAESDQERGNATRWFRESVPSRLNDLDKGAIVIIMQRLHEDDVSGVALAEDFGYCHLMIPWEFDPARAFDDEGKLIENEIGWSDPRAEEDDPDANAGEPAWLDRFSAGAMARLRNELGPYAWCNPGEAPVLMADLSLKRIDEVREGDQVVGFVVGDNKKRARLQIATVKSVSKSVQPVVKMLLDSGEQIRCTPDHKWFTGRQEARRKLYAPAYVGSRLRRVCPSRLEELTADEQRLAGWVSGFFDGEGSVSVQIKPKTGVHPTPQITFHQSAEQNLPLCEKLEYALARLGFEFGCSERQPANLSSAGVPWQKRRNYYLKSDAGSGFTKNGDVARKASRLRLNQRFLHVIQPTKWRQRLIDGTVGGRMYTTSERVVSIKPDEPADIVYGLETTTGNYVVWGLASSNSGQFEQSPTPRGKGIFQREWFKLYEHPNKFFPEFSYTVASLDGAFTEKESNDPSALTLWGVFEIEAGKRGAMLIGAWRKHLQFSSRRLEKKPMELHGMWRQRTMNEWGLMEWVYDSCTWLYGKQFKVDRLLIEDKGPGHSAAQELRNRYGIHDFGIQLVKTRGDKVARALAVQPIFSNGLVWAPNYDWAELVITEMTTFPYGRYDDLTDSATQALSYLRLSGLLASDEERIHAEQEMGLASYHKARQRPLYPVVWAALTMGGVLAEICQIGHSFIG